MREITSRLTEGLKDQIPDLRTRVDHILTKQVYGIAITDTPFACETFVASRIKDGESVFACADGHAYKHDLERTDKHGPFGTPYYNSITPAEYFAALAEVGGQQDMGDDPILDVLAPQRLGIHALLFDPDNRYATLPWQHIVRSYTELEQRINAEVGTVQL